MRIDKSVLLEIQTNMGYFEYKSNQVVGQAPVKQLNKCHYCGAEFEKKGRFIFCSTKCSNKYNYEQSKQARK
jgi:tRNA(Ile2) C34 agmatinyltransferase TiaS